MRYYAGGGDLDRLVNDPAADIHEVVREVERLCNREAHAAEYYREHPDLLGRWHPWLAFVASGEAAHLGWDAARCQVQVDAVVQHVLAAWHDHPRRLDRPHADRPGYREEWAVSR